MHIKKILTTVLAAAFFVTAMPAPKTAGTPFLTTVYARDNVSFYAGKTQLSPISGGCLKAERCR